MNDRIHRVLDGEMEAESLSPRERQQLASFGAAVDDVAHALRSVPRPDFAASVMAALPSRPPLPGPAVEPRPTESRLARAARWLWAPRPFAIAWRPAYAAGALLVLGLASGVAVRMAGTGDPTATAPSTEAVLYVQFRLEAPGAASVDLAGSFTNWDSAVHLVESAPGVWSTLVALEPGVHDYAFVIDGSTWVVDPTAPAVDDGFGGSNSRLFLTRPGGNV